MSVKSVGNKKRMDRLSKGPGSAHNTGVIRGCERQTSSSFLHQRVLAHPLYLCSIRKPCTPSYLKKQAKHIGGWVHRRRCLDLVDCCSQVNASSVADGNVLDGLTCSHPCSGQFFRRSIRHGLISSLIFCYFLYSQNELIVLSLVRGFSGS